MKTKLSQPANQSGPKKHFQKDGKWIVRPTRTEILLCNCGEKYIKTRAGQKDCLQCLARLDK